MSLSDLERAEQKVRKLMALAHGHGATKQEVETALRQAEVLIQKYQLSLADLLTTTKAAPSFDWDCQFVLYGSYGKVTWKATTVPTWYRVMAVGVAIFTDTLIKLHLSDEADRGAGVGYYGEIHDVELAVWLTQYLQEAVFWLAHDQKDLTRREKEAFRRGMADQLQDRLKDLREARDEQLNTANPRGTALVVVTTKLAQRDAQFGPQKFLRVRANDHVDGYHRGLKAGNEIALNIPISGPVVNKCLQSQ